MAVQKQITVGSDYITVRFYGFTSRSFNRTLYTYIKPWTETGSIGGQVTLNAYATECSYTFENLIPSTEYTLNFALYNNSTGQKIASYGPYTETTLPSPYSTGDTVYISTSNVSYNSATVDLYVTSRDYQRQVSVRCYRTSDGALAESHIATLGAYASSLSGINLSNLSSETQYKILVELLNPDGTTNATSSYTYITTSSRYASTDYGSLLVDSTTRNTAKLKLSITSRDYSRNIDLYVYTEDGVFVSSEVYSIEANTSSIDLEVISLDSATKYEFVVMVSNLENKITYTGQTYATTDSDYKFANHYSNVIAWDSENMRTTVSGSRPSSGNAANATYVHFYTKYTTSSSTGDLTYKSSKKFDSYGKVSSVPLDFFCYYGQTYTIDLYAWHSTSSTPPSTVPGLKKIQDTWTVTRWPREENVTVEVTQASDTSATITLTAAESRKIYDRTYTIYKNDTSVGTITIPAGSVYGKTSLTVTGLTAGSTYTFKASYSNGYTKGEDSVTFSIYGLKDSATLDCTGNGTSITAKLTAINSRSYARIVKVSWQSQTTGVTERNEKEFSLPAYTTTLDCIVESLPTAKYQVTVSIKTLNGDITWYKSAIVNPLDYETTLTVATTYKTVTATVTLNKELGFETDLTVYLNRERGLSVKLEAGRLTGTITWYTDIEAGCAYAITLVDNLKGENLTDGVTVYARTKNNFSWSTNVSSGKEFSLKADDWNELTEQMALKCNYYGISGYTSTDVFTTATKGNQLTADMYNEVAKAINKLVNVGTDCVTSVSEVSKGNAITAARINVLATCLNE